MQMSLEQNSIPHDSENLDNEPGSQSKDITEKDIEEDLNKHSRHSALGNLTIEEFQKHYLSSEK